MPDKSPDKSVKALSILSPRKYVKFSVWGPAYLKALSEGHIKKTAAAMAGVEFSTVAHRLNSDPDFARIEKIAENMGTARFMNLALARVTDPENPSDMLLRHLLSSRGITSTQNVQVTGKDGKPIEMDHAHTVSVKDQFPVHRLSLEAKKMLLAEMERIAQEDAIAAGKAVADRGNDSDISDAEYVEIQRGNKRLPGTVEGSSSRTISVLKGEDDEQE